MSCGFLVALEVTVREYEWIKCINEFQTEYKTIMITDYLNDLWRFNMSDSTWTWMSGSNIENHRGVVDTKGVPNVDSIPSARDSVAGWYDINTNEIWVFSGEAKQGRCLS